MSILHTTHGTWRTLKTTEQVLGLVHVEGYSVEEAVEEIRDDAARGQATAYNTLSPQRKAEAIAASTAMTELGIEIARSLLKGEQADALGVVSEARKVAEQHLKEAGRTVPTLGTEG
ncbi:hypothetical protein ACH4F6_37710 [Streptomyces sp. NPDC017936]|uniref:hypothetical protein n=1 Tax=Streptomyces sp. NPDC017936 TaxID=3365016 RepID=UPI0037ABEFF0